MISYKVKKKKKATSERGKNAIGLIRYGDYMWILFFHENESITAVTMDKWESAWQEETSLKDLSEASNCIGLDFSSWGVTDKTCNLRQVPKTVSDTSGLLSYKILV